MLHPALLVPELYLYSGRDTIATPRKVERHIEHRVQYTRDYLRSRPALVDELLASASRVSTPSSASATAPSAEPVVPGSAASGVAAEDSEARLERATRQLVRTHFFPTGAHVAILREHPHDYKRQIADMLSVANALYH